MSFSLVLRYVCAMFRENIMPVLKKKKCYYYAVIYRLFGL